MNTFNVSNNNTYDYMNSFFSGLNGSSSTSTASGASSLLSDYYSVQNGSYYKLAKKYYAKNNAEGAGDSDTADQSKLNSLAKSEAEAAVDSLSKLMKSSTYNKVTSKDDSGNSTTDYDRDSLLKDLKAFVEDYNSLVKTTSDMEDTSTLKSTLRMVKETKVYSGALDKLGVTIGKDNTLTIDEDAFGKADLSDMKNLFSKGVSFGSNTMTKLTQIYSAATNALSESNGTYSALAKTSASIGNFYDSIF